MSFDFNKYKRVFAFGCSFTNYYWPTWADIMAYEMPNAKFYNYGRSGAGNLFIANKVAEASSRFEFEETDLIMIMWTTLCREDRYFHGDWCLPGNIFTQGIYNKEFVERFCDPKGYLVRDLGLIKMTNSFLGTVKADTLVTACQPFDAQQSRDHYNRLDPSVLEILRFYKSMIKEIPPTMFDLEMNGEWENGHEYYDANHGNFPDYHPNPLRYYNYLTKLGIKLSDTTKQFAEESTVKLKSTKTKDEIIKIFGNEHPSGNHPSVRNLCF